MESNQSPKSFRRYGSCLECNVHLNSTLRLALQAWSKQLSPIRTIRKQGSVKATVSLHATLHVACTCASQNATPVSSLHHTSPNAILVSSIRQPPDNEPARKTTGLKKGYPQLVSSVPARAPQARAGRENVYIGLPIQQRTATSHKDKNWWAAGSCPPCRYTA